MIRRNFKSLIIPLLIILTAGAYLTFNFLGSNKAKVDSNSSEQTPSNSRFPDNPNINVDYKGIKLREIWLAGGCFWGVEAYMARIYGVANVESGYANGDKANPTYIDVTERQSGHTETVRVSYDPERVDLKTLLTYYFKIIDPTSKTKQGNDIGYNYRTGIYYKDIADLAVIQEIVKEEQKKYDNPIVTEVIPLSNYYPAEEYHQDYLEKNPNGYCHVDFSKLKK